MNILGRLFNKKQSLRDHLDKTRSLKICGVLFEIKKIDVLDYLNGSKVMLSLYDTYKVGKDGAAEEANVKKIKEHYRDVFMAGVVKPKLTRKNDNELVCVDELFGDWGMSEKLYTEIMKFTHGKKKL